MTVEPFATKSDYAYARVRRMVLTGELAPGAVLNQAVLARQVGVSTTPLREALRRLAQQGLVQLSAHRDARVTPLDASEARDLLEVRRALDPLAASLAAQRRTDDEVAELQAAADGLEALPADPTAEDLARHRRFHAAVYRASHNALLVDALDGLWDATDRYRLHGAVVSDRSADERADRADEHQRLAQAVVEGDAETAAAVMAAHVETSLGARSAELLSRRDGAGG